ncbi:protein of unknown function [Ekhidna lutea]|uniref:DUF2779 domain-containing protein n=1 Tax=Ekhidna lutea TaxID=447679 RepID=A0A239LFY0_EKHLU|nr:DUF2779 domain-containing protein [Ekhidna lutea]SNT28743.1 protein of unknown function [Ekhidna lutea]
MRPRYLTKSRFKQALECPTKLFYTGKKDEYADNSQTDDFLMALAKGGYQVGELAKYYFSGGHDIDSLDYEESLSQTEELLKQENVIIYEAAIRFENLFVRVDVLVKKGNHVKLIEVKSKSLRTVDEFYTQTGIKSEWKPYLYDVAFQKHVLTKAYPEFTVEGMLMLADKTVNATVDGLYQRFLINDTGTGRLSITAKDTDDLGVPILKAENVDHAIELIWNGKEMLGDEELSFADYVHALSEAYAADKKLEFGVSGACKSCQFRSENGLKSGFHECWTSMTPLSNEQVSQPLVTSIWNSRKTDSFIKDGIYLQKDVDPEELGNIKANPPKSGLQSAERQRMQVEKSREKDNSIYLDREGLAFEMSQVTYPLHMIDFETTAVPIPFHKGTRPYEQHAFQFSHHIIEKDGSVRHSTQWINEVPGRFPNFEFVRALRDALANDSGSVFRYSHHENTILNAIRRQLVVSDETDSDRLIKFIDSITHRTEGKGKDAAEFAGPRDMIDLCDWVQRFYYDPETNGSNSLKAILPSILNRSKKLQGKYGEPIYGSEIESLNFKDHIWLQKDGDWLLSPYKQLPKLWEKHDRDEVDRLINPTDELEDGGAAMTAYNYMQFDEMSEVERKATIAALYHYCELDTLAMVMLWEGFQDLISN